MNALDTQSSFHILEFRDLISKGIHSVFSLLVLIKSGVGFSRTAKRDNSAGVPFPLHIAGMNLLQSLLLREIISHESIQGLVFGVQSLHPLQIVLKEALVAGRDVSTCSGFHVDHQLEQVPGSVENLTAMVNPQQGLVQVVSFP